MVAEKIIFLQMYQNIFQRVKWFLNVKMIHLEKIKRSKCQSPLYRTLLSFKNFWDPPSTCVLIWFNIFLATLKQGKFFWRIHAITNFSNITKWRHCHSTKYLILIDDICTISKGAQTEGWGSGWSCYIICIKLWRKVPLSLSYNYL